MEIKPNQTSRKLWPSTKRTNMGSCPLLPPGGATQEDLFGDAEDISDDDDDDEDLDDIVNKMAEPRDSGVSTNEYP